ncbi:MAG: recombinase family protein [Verrucomicrobiae bacterium]|nr:recombinase family protein [Verrucomicrobiae bacterium]
MNTKTTIAIYSRVSTDKQDAENQLAQLRDFASKQGWQIAGEYIDHAVSGTKAGASRPAFARMMQDASQRRFDVLLFWSLDRLSREGVSATLDYLNRLSGWGVGFRSFSEPYLDSLGVFKDAVLAILACIAKQERIRISERTKAGLERAKRHGKRLGRPGISEAVAEQIRSLRAVGVSVREVAQKCGVSVGLVAKLA